MPRLRVHCGDHAVFGDLAGDPPPPVRAVAAFGGLHVLPGDQRQQRHRGGCPAHRGPALQHRDQRVRVVHQRRDQRVLRLRVIPVDPRLARSAVIVAGAQLRDLPRRPRHHPGYPADRGDQLGDRVLRRHRIRQDRRVHRTATPALQHPRLPDHLRDRLADPVRAIRLRQPPPPVHQSGGIKPAMIQREPARRLPPQITPGRLRRLGVGVIMQHLQHHHRRDHARRHRRPPRPRREQVREVLLGEQLPRCAARNANMLPSGTRCPTSACASSNCRSARSALHETIIPGHRTHCRQTRHRSTRLFSGLPGRLRLIPPRLWAGLVCSCR